jgi:hypothetical protein
MRIDSKPRQRSRAAMAVIISTAMLLASELCCAQASEREDWQILVVDAALNTPYFYDPTTRSGVIPSQPDDELREWTPGAL